MKVLSLLQPWASLVITPHPEDNSRGIKQWETRCWRPKDIYLIEQLKTDGFLIHASKGWKTDQANLMSKWPFDQYEYNFSMDFGAIIGHVKLVDIFKTETWLKKFGEPTDEEYFFGNYSPNRFAFLLKEPKLFEEPILISGALGFWNYNEIIPEIQL